ncbi:MAG: cytidine/deoxycytidylate deaminase family protein [Patescibacteria group bacterium]
MSEERNHYRPSWDDYFMAIAKIIASRGTCDRLYSGAVLVKNNRIISTGYNGSPAALPHCHDAGHLLEDGHCVRTIHGEHNAILQAAVQGGTSTVGSTMYTKYNPCIHCTKYVIAAGITRVVLGKIYRSEKAVEMLKEAGIQVDIYQENPEWSNEIVKMFTEEIPERINEGAVKFQETKTNE